MSFLKKLGQVLVKGLQIVTGLGPVVTQYAPNAAGTLTAVEDTLGQIIAAVQSAEAMGAALTLTGPQKLTAAAPLVEQAVLALFKARGWNIGDETAFKAAVAKLTGDVADLLNSVNDGSVQTTGV